MIEPSESGRGLQGTTVLIGVLAFVALGASTAGRAASNLQSELTAEAQRQLALAGLPRQDVTFDGRNALLSGALASPEISEQASAVVAGVPGVHTVTHRPLTETSAAVRIEVSASEIVLEGRIPNQDARVSLERAARDRAGRRRVTERMVVEPGVDEPAWLTRGSEVLGPLVTAGAGVIRLERGVLTVRSTVETGEARHSLLGALRAEFPSLEIVDDIVVSEVTSEVQTAIDRAVAGRAVDFDRSGTAVSSAGAGVLDDVARVLVQHPSVTVGIDVIGTDPTATSASGDWRRDRAERVRDYLVRRGVRSDRIRVGRTAAGADPTAGTRSTSVQFTVVR